jgi:hypothetical protein
MPIYMKYDTFLSANQFVNKVSGLSHRGAQQFLVAQMVTDGDDRRALASAMFEKLGLVAITDGTSYVKSGQGRESILIGLLRPAPDNVSIGLLQQAAQKIRIAAAKTKPPLNLTDLGLLRFLSGEPVPNQSDRAALAFVVTELFALPKGI